MRHHVLPHLRAALLAVTACFAACTSSPSSEGRLVHNDRTDGGEARRPDDPLAAARFRGGQRLNADGTIPDNAIMRAKEQRDAMIRARGLDQTAFGTRAPAWTNVGPTNIGGRLRAIVIHPTDSSTIYIGTAGGGVWKTTNGGGVWSPLDDFLPSLSVSSLAMDPTNSSILLAGTGEGFFETQEGSSNTASIRGAGIFKTTDAGATWAQLPSTANSNWYHVNRLAYAPGSATTLLAATQTGIYRSTDAGVSWTLALAGIAYDVQFHPTDPLKAIAGMHDDRPRYSNNGGITWLTATGPSAVHRAEVRYARSNPSIVYAALANANQIKLWRSTNGGASYTIAASATAISTYESYNDVLWVDPTNPATVLIGGVYLYRTTNSGTNITSTFSGVHPDHHAIVADPGFNGTGNKTVYFGTDGGVYKTTDVYATAPATLNNGLAITQFYGAAMNPTTGVMIGGAQDNGTMRYTGSTAWSSFAGGDGAYCAADPTDPNTFYGSYQWLQLWRTGASGGILQNMWSGITEAGGTGTNFISFFMLDPNQPLRLLACTRQLWRTQDAKANPVVWASIKPSLPGPDGPSEPPPAHMNPNDPRNISTVAVAEGDSNVIWVAHNGGALYKTSNGTAGSPTWTLVESSTGGSLPDRWPSRIVIDPDNHGHVFVSFMGWAGDNVWMTLDGGASWTDITGTGAGALPDVPVGALARHRTRGATLFAGTDIGLFVSYNNGVAWSPVVDGIAAVTFDELVWKNDTTLLAVTHGRGIYQGDVTPGCLSDYDFNTFVNGDDYDAFVLDFEAGNRAADIDGNGFVNGVDFDEFVAAFEVGC